MDGGKVVRIERHYMRLILCRLIKYDARDALFRAIVLRVIVIYVKS